MIHIIRMSEMFMGGEKITPDIVNLINKASYIINKELSVYEKDRKTVIKEISDFIEKNIDNKDLSKEIDELIDINKALKNK